MTTALDKPISDLAIPEEIQPNIFVTSPRQNLQLEPPLILLADAVRPGLLRHRDDLHRRPAATTSPASAPRSSAPRPARPT